MGLSIEVGRLAEELKDHPEGRTYLEGAFAAANRLLAKHGLPAHEEPRTLPALKHRAQLIGFPYSFIHYLRRASAHRRADPRWVLTPLGDGEKPTSDPLLQVEASSRRNHLICHSDAEGFYLPVDFTEVLIGEGDTAVPGGMLGSSLRLMEELVEVAPALNIQLGDGQLTDEEATRLNKRSDRDHREGYPCFELDAWFLLFECARLSIEHRTAIVFC